MNKEFFKTTEFKIFISVFLILSFFVSDYGGNFIMDSMLYQTMSIVDNGKLEIDDYIKEGCKETGCAHAYYKGHWYSGFAPGMSFLAVPVYALFKPLLDLIPEIGGYNDLRLSVIVLNFLVNILIGAVSAALGAVLIYKITGFFTTKEKYKILLSFVSVLGSLFFVYSSGSSRSVGAVFAVFAFYLLLKSKYRILKNKNLFFAGLSSGIAVALDYSYLIILVVLGVYALSFLRNKKILLFVLGALIPGLFLLGYNYAVYDNMFSSPYQNRAMEWTKELFAGDYIHWKNIGIESLYGLSVSPEKGLFVYMPFFILSLIGIIIGLVNEKKFRAEILTLLGIVLGMFVYNAAYFAWHANCGFGPRYLVPMIPFFMIGSIFVIKRIWFFISVAVGGVSVFINLLGAMYGREALWSGLCFSKNALAEAYIPFLLSRGLTNYTLNLIKFKEIFSLNVIWSNVVMVVLLGLIGGFLYLVWKRS